MIRLDLPMFKVNNTYFLKSWQTIIWSIYSHPRWEQNTTTVRFQPSLHPTNYGGILHSWCPPQYVDIENLPRKEVKLQLRLYVTNPWTIHHVFHSNHLPPPGTQQRNGITSDCVAAQQQKSHASNSNICCKASPTNSSFSTRIVVVYGSRS